MRWALLLLLLIIGNNLTAQVPFYKEIPVGDNDQPLPVHMLARSNGYLLVATSKGLYRYNGTEFKLMPATASMNVTAIAASKQWTWVGTKGGKIYRYSNDTMQLLLQAENSAINGLTAMNDSQVVAATDNMGLVLLSNKKVLQQFTSQRGLSDDYVYECLAVPGSATVVAGTDEGINILADVYKGNALSRVVSTAAGLTDNIIRAICYDAERKLIVAGGQQGGLCSINYDSAPVRISSKTPNWEWGQINDIIRVADNCYWVCTETGKLLEARAGDTTFRMRVLYSGTRQLKKLLPDNGGNIWCATNDGLILFSAPIVGNVIVPLPYSLKKVTAVCHYGNRIMYAAGNELYSVGADNIPVPFHRTKEIITALHTDASGRLWIGTLGQGILCIAGSKTAKAAVVVTGSQNSHIISLTSVGDTLWAAGLEGVDEIKVPDDLSKSKRIRHHNKRSGIGSDYVYQVYADSRRRIWMATDGAGVCMYDRGHYHHFEIPGFTSMVAYSVAEDSKRNIWLGTLRDGLFSYNGRSWTRYGAESGLSDPNVTTIAPGANGRVIIVHKRGVDEYYPKQRVFRHYNRRLGMDIDSTSAILNCYAADAAKNIYIPYEHGFMSFTAMDVTVDARPAIAISAVKLFLQPIAGNRQHFSPSENSFSFTFDGVNFTNPDKLYYRYKLTGYNSDWVTTADETAIFPQLPPGRYRFVVQASLAPNFSSPAQAEYAFTISRPLWKRWWFITLCSVMAAAALIAYFRYRERKLRRIAKLEKERHNYEYEYLKSQVNPHFLFNSLNTLANLIEEDVGMATDYTINLSDFYRNLLTYNNSDVITLGEEWELLRKYVYIQKSRFGDALNVELVAAERDMKSGRIVPMALQLLVENAIKHNIVSRSQPLHILISVKENEITVENNIQPKQSKEKGAGLGLANLRKRYKADGKTTFTQYVDNNKFIVKLPVL